MYLFFIILSGIGFVLIRSQLNNNSKVLLTLIWFSLFIFLGTFAYYTDDYDTYQNIVTKIYSNSDAAVHIEGIWIKFAEYCNNNIDMFRALTFLVIALLILILTFRTNVQIPFFLGYYSLLCLSNHLVWLRQPVAIMIFLIGFTYILSRHYFLGIIWLVLSCIFHKSGLMFMALLPFVLLPLNKYSILCLLISVPLIWYVIQPILMSGTNLELIILNNYASSDGIYENRNILFKIFFFIEDYAKIILNFYLYYRFAKQRTPFYYFLLKYLMIINLLIIGLKALPIGSDVLTTRLFSMTDLIAVLVLANFIKNKIYIKRNICLLLLIVVIYGATEIMSIGRNFTNLSIFFNLPF